MIDIVRKHLVKIVVGAGVILIFFVVVSVRSGSKDTSVATQPSSEGEKIPAETMLKSLSQQKKKKQAQQPPVRREGTDQDTSGAGSTSRQEEKITREIGELKEKLKEVEQRTALLRQDEIRRDKARKEQIETMENHAKQIESLGNTLQRVLKTPRQIRIMVTDLETQVRTIRSQIQSQSRTVGSSPIDKEIWTEKRTLMEQQASDLEAVSLDLQRTQGDPSRVRVAARNMLRRSEKLRATIEHTKRQKVQPNKELLALEKKEATLKKRIQELQGKVQVQKPEEKKKD